MSRCTYKITIQYIRSISEIADMYSGKTVSESKQVNEACNE